MSQACPAHAYSSDDEHDQQRESSSNSAPPIPILQLTSLAMLNTQLAAGLGMDSAARALKVLAAAARESGARAVVFCGDTVHPTLQFIASAHSIVLVSRRQDGLCVCAV